MISVIIPVYNVEKYLDKCLHSVLTNTYRDLEVICVNDGSTDSSPEILQKWKAQDPRIIIVSHENRGLPEARNSGLEVMTGEYTAFIDADDWVHPKYFESMLKCMEENEADVVVAGVQRFEPEEEIKVDLSSEISYLKITDKECYKNYFSRRPIWGRLLRSRDTRNLRFPPEVDAHQDSLYNLRLIASLKQPNVYATVAPLYFYLQRPGSLVKTRNYETVLEIADWYAVHRQSLLLQKGNKWTWLLLLHCIATVLSSRYTAILFKNQEVVNHTNNLLQIMLKDLLKNKQIGFGSRFAHAILIRYPEAYRIVRILRDPSMLKFERTVRTNRT